MTLEVAKKRRERLHAELKATETGKGPLGGPWWSVSIYAAGMPCYDTGYAMWTIQEVTPGKWRWFRAGGALCMPSSEVKEGVHYRDATPEDLARVDYALEIMDVSGF
jgi:hypothetical protein